MMRYSRTQSATFYLIKKKKENGKKKTANF